MKILIADDNSGWSNLLKIYLEHQGHDILVSYQGDTALVKLRENQIDLLILDYDLPVLNGPNLLNELNKDIIVIVISGYDCEYVKEKFEESHNILRFFQKPFSLVKINEVVNDCKKET